MTKKYIWTIISVLIAVCFVVCIWLGFTLYTQPTSNTDRINIVLAVASTTSTIFAALSAIVAFSTVSEMRKEHREQNAPFVYIDCPVNKNHHVDLQIQNLGKSAAKNIQIEFDASPIAYNGQRLSDYPTFQNPIPLLGPNREWRFFIDTILSILDDKNVQDTDKCPKEFSIAVTYQDDTGYAYKKEYLIDFRSWENRSFVVSTPEESLDKIAKELEDQRMERLSETMNAQIRASIMKE